ncbi:MAG: hypothetical protein WBN77_11595 [Desulfobacterales bacterium]
MIKILNANKPLNIYIYILLTVIPLSLVLSCSNNPLSTTTKITDILASPSKHTDELVRVKGKVTESFLFLGQGYFMLADDTGTIAVIPSKTYPKAGEVITIKGQVKNAFVIGNQSLTVIIENPQ